MAAFLPHLCLQNIFQHFSQDLKTLYSCALVNTHWCIATIPELWQDPFKSCHKLREPIRLAPLVNTYISFLSPATIKSLGITPKIQQPTFFNYPVYLHNINLNLIHGSIEYWKSPVGDQDSKDTEQVLVELEKITQLCKVLCEYFLCHSSRIDHLDICYTNWDIFQLEGAKKSLSKIKSFEFDGDCFPNQLKTLTSINNNIQDLSVTLIGFGDKSKIIEDIVTLIQAQNNLCSIRINITFTSSFQNLWDNLFMSPQANSIKTIEFRDIIFDSFNTFLPLQLSKFKKLENLRIYKCRNFDGDVREVNDLLAFVNLYQIRVERISLKPEFFHLLLKSGNNLTEIELLDQIIEGFDEIINWCGIYCKNLTRFVASIQKNQIHNIIDLLQKCPNLEYFHVYDVKLKFEHEYDPWPEYSPPELLFFPASELMKEFGEKIPKKMKVIKIWMNWLITLEELEKFVERCVSNALNLKVMEFRHCVGFGNSHRDVIKRYL
ncbi:7774_t:CDS:1 [Diversispora eburnea]|uniref:7774_t:CDS:1 n=1 Tax=Diversispora eburnea TaxID=1213867 RepID=A0A9N8YPN8_9GLOM|nr:7774_t:CDS:1 [Diversispora eburnea]